MADSKISDLTALTTQASGDLLPIVDVSEAAAADKNKSITIQELFRGIPVSVGIGVASPNYLLDLSTSSDAPVHINSTNENGPHIRLAASGTVKHYFGSGGGFSLGDVDDFAIRSADNIIFSTNNNSTENARIDSSGRVGIGTSSPTHNLTIGDTAAADFVLALRGGVGGFLGWDDSANCTILQAPNTRSLQFRVNSDTFSAGTMAMHINSSGNVGIGTTPSRKLSVYDASLPALSLHNPSTGTTTSDGFQVQLSSLDAFLWNYEVGAIIFGTSNDEKVRINSDGDLGIGTSTPSSRLTVVDSSSDTAGASGAFIDINNTDGNTGVVSGIRFKNGGTDSYKGAIYFEDTAGDARGDLIFATNDVASGATEVGLSDARMTITRGGKVGIGVTSPDDTLHLVGSTGYGLKNTDGTRTVVLRTAADGAILKTASNHPLLLGTSDNERARIDSSGRLLVNTTSSSISGVAHFSGHAGNPTYSGLISITRGINSGSVVSGHGLGGIQFGSLDAKVSAFIGSEADAAWGTNDYPGRLVFHTTTNGGSSPTEHGRFTETGAFKASTDGTYAGTTSAYHELVQHNNNTNVFYYSHKGNSTPYGGGIAFSNAAPDDNTRYFLDCRDNVAVRLRIYSDGDVQNHDNSYGAISDEKLKQDIVDAGSQWDDLKNLRVRKFKFKSDVEAYGDDAKTLIGVVAQEAEAVSPGLVKDNPDLDADNNDLGTTTKTVNYSVLYMKAVKALQEAMERIETLEAKVAALESA